MFLFLETKGDEDENVPSMEALEISKKSTIQSIPTYFGGEEEDDIPDMADYEEPDNLIENDPVSHHVFCISRCLVIKCLNSWELFGYLMQATLQSTYLVAHEPDEDNILRTRTYDVSIM